MKNFKTVLWIFIIFLIQTVIFSRIHIFSISLSLVFPYVMCVMILENEFRVAAWISVVCAAVAGALCGRDFSLTVLYIVYVSLIVFALRSKPVYIMNSLKAVFWTFVSAGVFEILCFALDNGNVTTEMLLYDALGTAALDALLSAVIYPILKCAVYKEEKKKLLIGELV